MDFDALLRNTMVLAQAGAKPASITEAVWFQIGLVVLGSVLGLALALFLQPLLEDRAQRWLVNILGALAPRPKDSLAGEWICRWSKDGEPYKQPMKLKVKQFGRWLTTSFEYEGRVYTAQGKVERESIVTGSYYDQLAGATFHGAFQLWVLPRQLTMSGKWMGFNASNEVISGPWEWKRATVDKFPSEYSRTPGASPSQ
jgi:hypothetical protein